MDDSMRLTEELRTWGFSQDAPGGWHALPIGADFLVRVEAGEAEVAVHVLTAQGAAVWSARLAGAPLDVALSVVGLAAGLPFGEAGSLFDLEDSRRCFRCGCTAERGCPGGCEWVAGPVDADLCSQCAQEMAVIAAALADAADYRGPGIRAGCEACTRAPGRRCAAHHGDEDRAARYRELLSARYSAYLRPQDPASQ